MEVSFYGVPLGGSNYVAFVLDRSGSMKGEKLAAAKRELINALRSFPDGTQVAVLFFGNHVSSWPKTPLKHNVARFFGGRLAKAAIPKKELISLSPASRQEMAKFISEITAYGHTAAVPALRRAVGLGARHLVFLSDGRANRGGNPEDLLAQAEEYASRGIRIDTVSLDDPTSEVTLILRQMSRRSGGIAVVR